MRERQKKKKGRTWAEAAKTVLEKYPNTPMSHKEILQVIQRERLKEISGTSPLACLNAMLHTNSRGDEGIFYKVPGRMGVYTLKKDFGDVVKELSEDASEDSSDDMSDTRCAENTSTTAYIEEGCRRRWTRRAWQLKQASSPQNSTSSSSSSIKDACHTTGTRKASQCSGRLSSRQLRRTKCDIDVETPDSILVNTNLRALINKHTFSMLPTECQQKLMKMLPDVDQQANMDGVLKVTSSALNNEFFTSAAQSWKERLSEGEFTPELRLRIRQEIEKEKKMDLWKEHFFESYYGEHSGLSIEESKVLMKARTAPEPVKRTVLSGKPEIVIELHKLKPMKEVIHMELRSRDVKSTFSHVSLEELKKPAPAQESQASTRKGAKSAVLIESSVDPSPCTEKIKENIIISKTTTSPLEEEAACLKRKEELTTKEENPTIEAEQNEEERSKAGSPSITVEPQKRKVCDEEETELSAEKKLRVSPSELQSTVTAKEKVEQRVPPLKIPVSRILSAPASIEQVSPRTHIPLTPPSIRPGCTGARTLADIKAKAKLARARRVAAAAAGSSSSKGTGSVGGTSTPSPAWSLSEEYSPASSQSVSPIKPSSVSPTPESTVILSQTSPSSGSSGHQGFAQGSSTNQVFVNRPLLGSQGTQGSLNPALHCSGGEPSTHAGNQTVQTPVTQNQKSQQTLFTGASLTKYSSLIPANNPLVTQLLQGKEVPLEKILPKPLAKVEARSVGITNRDKGSPGVSTPSLKKDSPNNREVKKSGNQFSFDSSPTEVSSSDNFAEVGLQVQREQKHLVSNCLPFKFHPFLLVDPEISQQQRVYPRIFGCKRASKPAMTGHYLLNISTYGRGSESSKRTHLTSNTSTSITNLKTETIKSKDGLKASMESQAGSNAVFQEQMSLPNVKLEQQGGFISKPEDGFAPQTCTDIKAEAQYLSCVSSPEEINSNRTKDPCSRLQETCSKQGKPEPYLLSDQRIFLSHKAHSGPQYGGTISMSVPQALNLGKPKTPTPPVVSSSRDGDTAGDSLMSFSVTVTAIPASHMLDQGGQGESPPKEAFIETSKMEEVQSQCYCRLKAMIICKGCGAFCHDDCIGPSKLCVSCLVVR
ncbi:hypothetical protein DNTS_032760 [Danionella cerebrum]|uniref:Polycomb group protein ASXL2 n=1 Tax=Danionella cerebrum TaxID=2873325 RepID=A0A553QAK9_9TELE|nr:hypothetical protein DNTS_032760 [Danionella translucida]